MTQPESGPLADEAAKLIGAAQEWLHRVVGDPATARIANNSPECCWCPLCQLIATLRGDRPELTERLSETRAAFAGLLRALADAAATAGAPTEHAPRPSRTHRIDLDADDASATGDL